MTDAPMPLEAAVRVFFPHGGVTKSTLLAAIRAGTLGFEKVGRAYLVTEADISAWRTKCRDEAKARACTSTKGQDDRRSTSSATERAALAQAAPLAGITAGSRQSLRAWDDFAVWRPPGEPWRPFQGGSGLQVAGRLLCSDGRPRGR